MTDTDVAQSKQADAPAFTLPTYFPPTHGVRGGDGRVTYRAETAALIEGYRNLLVDIIVPPRDGDRSVPVVVFIHGGAFIMGATEEVWSPWFHTMQEKILAAGFAFASLTYRFSAEASFPAQLVDVKAGLRYVRHFAADLGLDSERVALWGGSAGAHLALLVALTPGRDLGVQIGVDAADEPVRAVVDYFGLTDILAMPESERGDDSVLSRLLGGPVADRADLARDASPIAHLHADAPPILVVHGTDDGAIGIDQSRSFVTRARALGALVELVEIEGADHGFVTVDIDPILERSIAFLCTWT